MHVVFAFGLSVPGSLSGMGSLAARSNLGGSSIFLVKLQADTELQKWFTLVRIVR